LEGKINDLTPATTSRETNTSIGTHSTAAKIDELEQRARSWNLRLTGVAPDVEDTDKLVIDIAASIGVKLNQNDIDCSHYVGSTLQKHGRQIIVRLTRRNVIVKLFKVKKDLRKDDNVFNKVYINEDLTQHRYSMLQRLLLKKREGRIVGAWSHQGRIFYRVDGTSKPVRVSNILEFDPDSI
jgi:hypothetical protein